MVLESMKTAELHRMDLKDHTCPFGIKAKALLEREGYEVRDHVLKTRKAVDAFKAQHNVKTTPQIWIDNKHIGGHDDLRAHLGKSCFFDVDCVGLCNIRCILTSKDI